MKGKLHKINKEDKMAFTTTKKQGIINVKRNIIRKLKIQNKTCGKCNKSDCWLGKHFTAYKNCKKTNHPEKKRIFKKGNDDKKRNNNYKSCLPSERKYESFTTYQHLCM